MTGATECAIEFCKIFRWIVPKWMRWTELFFRIGAGLPSVSRCLCSGSQSTRELSVVMLAKLGIFYFWLLVACDCGWQHCNHWSMLMTQVIELCLQQLMVLFPQMELLCLLYMCRAYCAKCLWLCVVQLDGWTSLYKYKLQHCLEWNTWV